MFHKLLKVLRPSLVRIRTELLVRHIRDGKVIAIRRVLDKCVTTAFVNYLVDALQAGGGAINQFKYHDSGTGVVAESITDTTLGTPTGEARDTGTQAENAANIYESVATHTYAGTFAITEHGLFNQSSGGTLMDRTVFAAVNVVATDKIEFTFRITFTAGG